MATATLQWPDYLIMVIFLVISIGIGIYHSVTGGKQRTTAEFIMADRRLKVIPTAISLLVTFQSAMAILGFSAESYCFGIQYFILTGVFSTSVAMFIVCGVLVPLFYPLKLVSINEYLERRFLSRNVRMFAASLGIISGILYNGSALFATSSALESATGLSLKVSVPLMVIAAVTYTALGGMRAVIWTDVFQFVIMVGGMAAIFIKRRTDTFTHRTLLGISSAGGVGEVFRLAEREGRLNWIDFNPDPRVRHTVWGLTIGMTLTMLHTFGFTQASVQRYSAVKTIAKAKLTVLINIPPLVLMISVNSLMGLVVLAYYATIQCDPIANRDVTNVNQLLPFFVFDIFSNVPGFAGLFLATLYGASLSSISTYLSGTAANTWEDILQWKLAKLTESRKALINRLLIIVIGAISCTVAFLAATMPGPITQVALSLLSSVGGPIVGMFLLGAISKHANSKGALIGGFLGLAFSLWLSTGSLLMRRRPTLLPPVSVEGCKAVNESFAFNYNSSLGFETTDYTIKSYWHEDVTDMSLTHPNTEEQHWLNNFYNISYVWFALFSALVTIIIGFAVSLITRDKKLEADVDDRYLIRFRNICERRWDDEEQDKEDGSEEKLSSNTELEKYGAQTIKANQLLTIDDEDITKETKERLGNI